MTVRNEVRRLADLGPLTDEEAELLLTVFGPDDCFGMAWTLLHLVETSPTPYPRTEPPADANQWHRRLWRRAQNAGDDG